MTRTSALSNLISSVTAFDEKGMLSDMMFEQAERNLNNYANTKDTAMELLNTGH